MSQPLIGKGQKFDSDVVEYIKIYDYNKKLENV